jgi:hypothetical protein
VGVIGPRRVDRAGAGWSAAGCAWLGGLRQCTGAVELGPHGGASPGTTAVCVIGIGALASRDRRGRPESYAACMHRHHAAHARVRRCLCGRNFSFLLPATLRYIVVCVPCVEFVHLVVAASERAPQKVLSSINTAYPHSSPPASQGSVRQGPRDPHMVSTRKRP